jgi:hypothetical protein
MKAEVPPTPTMLEAAFSLPVTIAVQAQHKTEEVIKYHSEK